MPELHEGHTYTGLKKILRNESAGRTQCTIPWNGAFGKHFPAPSPVSKWYAVAGVKATPPHVALVRARPEDAEERYPGRCEVLRQAEGQYTTRRPMRREPGPPPDGSPRALVLAGGVQRRNRRQEHVDEQRRGPDLLPMCFFQACLRVGLQNVLRFFSSGFQSVLGFFSRGCQDSCHIHFSRIKVEAINVSGQN